MSGTIKYVLPIREALNADVHFLLSTYEKDYDFFEIWLDYIHDFDLSVASEFATQFAGRLIFVVRQEGGKPERLSANDLLSIFQLAAEKNCFVDLDLEVQKDAIQIIGKLERKPQLILSFHDFDHTPSNEVLEEKVGKARLHGADVVKIACFCRSESEALRLLSFGLELKALGERYIVLGMGEHGKVTRVFGTLWGNELIYAPADACRSTAPGQMKLGALRVMFDALQVGAEE